MHFRITASLWLALGLGSIFGLATQRSATLHLGEEPSYAPAFLDGRPVEIYYTRSMAILRDGRSLTFLPALPTTEGLAFGRDEIRIEIGRRRNETKVQSIVGLFPSRRTSPP